MYTILFKGFYAEYSTLYTLQEVMAERAGRMQQLLVQASMNAKQDSHSSIGRQLTSKHAFATACSFGRAQVPELEPLPSFTHQQAL